MPVGRGEDGASIAPKIGRIRSKSHRDRLSATARRGDRGGKRACHVEEGRLGGDGQRAAGAALRGGVACGNGRRRWIRESGAHRMSRASISNPKKRDSYERRSAAVAATKPEKGAGKKAAAATKPEKGAGKKAAAAPGAAEEEIDPTVG